ncbi:F0F1 ATP synthase subunit B [Falsirhodobacter algicola]|uniref:ATP synthase subunit b n=1 Tax=Falsirhodobacter algicola TaxID=2692330 RepID=A0A8J8MTT4_9RHOB|nr:F0F1 ATP synthase subunit B [Falsirhodobacter algicola]QUS36616.1 F0F1 ATP synthase subunit B [Falsirhodobacter algicola]
MKKLIIPFTLLATPAVAAPSGPFFSLYNTNLIVLIAFVLFVGILIWAKVPGRITGMLDKRAHDIHSELEEARALREEAKALLASYERKQQEVSEQSARIIAQARQEATLAAERAKEVLQVTIARRMQAAEDQIAAAEAGAVKEVREKSIAVAVEAAREVLARQMTPETGASLIDRSIEQVGQKMH